MNVPDDRRYTDQHEWVLTGEGPVRMGVTDYAQEELGDVVFVDVLVELEAQVEAGQVVAELESTKSVAEVYAPFAGTIAEVNDALTDAPEKVNQDPYGAGWFLAITPDDPAAATKLLDAAAYTALIS